MYAQDTAPGGAQPASAVPYAPTGPRTVTGRTAVGRNVAEGRGFSLYLQEVGRMVEEHPESYVLVMPDEDGALPENVLRRRTGVVVSWPTNPHNSGEAAILDRLNDAEARKSFSAPVTAAGYAPDQHGRHHRIS